jgi:hypothetical protein
MRAAGDRVRQRFVGIEHQPGEQSGRRGVSWAISRLTLPRLIPPNRDGDERRHVGREDDGMVETAHGGQAYAGLGACGRMEA